MARDVAHAAKAVVRAALMAVAKVAVKDAIAVVDAVDAVGNAAANASVLMPKENRWPLATTPRA